MDEEELPPGGDLYELGRYPQLSMARECGLVLAAMDVPYWIVRDGRLFVLQVLPQDAAAALAELARYEAERVASVAFVPREELPEPSRASLFAAGWVMATFWFVQNLWGDPWIAKAEASSQLILKGEWWRVFTALGVHGDFSHFAANTAAGLLFAAFALRHFGTGWTWLGLVLSGGAGNFLNALFYSGSVHISLGASTAVFGALGMIIGAEVVARARQTSGWGSRHLLIPLGTGFALLAFLGSGDPKGHTDYMAHLWGMLSGLGIGVVAATARVRERSSNGLQWVAGLGALGALALACWRALV